MRRLLIIVLLGLALPGLVSGRVPAAPQQARADAKAVQAAPSLNPNSLKWGFIDKQGTFVISPQFADAGSFSDGLAAVRIGDRDQLGFIDKQGTFVINPQFDEVGSVGDEGWHLLHVGSFHDGLAAVCIGGRLGTGKWGFIDKQGTFVVSPQFADAVSFSDGLAYLSSGKDRTLKSGFIDKRGKTVTISISRQFGLGGSFSDGLAPVCVLARESFKNKWGFIDKQGKTVIKPQFHLVRSFSDGLAPVLVGERTTGQWGYIDKQGQIVIKPQFDEAQPFSEGLARVRIGDWKTGQ